MSALVLAVLAGYGTHLAYTAIAYRWHGLRIAPRPVGSTRVPAARRLERWMQQAGLGDVRPSEFVGVAALLAIVGAATGAAIFGGVVPAIVLGAFAATVPAASYRVRRANRQAVAHDAWPQLIEEVRVLTGAAGRSIPQALLEVGRRGPDELRAAFEAAHREWLLTTDFERTVEAIKSRLADPTADAACETLLVAHEVGGNDLDQRLAALAEDRRADTLARKDARSKQAGVRFARRFVIAVPLGMAAAGMSLGDGRDAYRTPVGQILVTVGLAVVAACWAWSGSMLRLPSPSRVFD
ncbi:MAG: type II secretion system F family protein [Acidimicrobiales bacterium]